MRQSSEDSLRILYLGDDPESAEMAAASLGRQNGSFDVETAASLGDAWRALSTERVDCLVSEYDLSETNGLEVLDDVRAERPDLPFVLHADEKSGVTASEAMAAGATEYVRKGGDGDQFAVLARRIESSVDGSRAENGVERELEDEREFLDQALDTLDDLFYVVDTDGHMRRWNERVTEVTGYSNEEVAAMRASEFFPAESRMRVTNTIEETLTAGCCTLEAEILTADGTRLPYEFVVRRLTDSAGDVVGVVGIGRDMSDRKQREQKVTALHDVADDLATSESVKQVCERTIEASQEILTFDLSVIDIEEDGMLEKTAISENIPPENLADMPVDEGIAGKTYRTGKSFLIEDLAEYDEANPQGPYESAISVPIGDHGVFQAVAETPAAFDDTDLELAELLISHTESALDRLDRERRLQRQNERLAEFASVVSHDLRNPLNVAQGRLEMARRESDSEHLDDVAAAHERMAALIDDLLLLAREGELARERKPVSLATMMEQCWRIVETREADLDVDADQTLRADPGRFKELLENLVRNAVQHAGDDVCVTVGAVNGGFYVADDGPGIPESEREEVFEMGYSSAEDGTGLGLNIVKEIVDAHGWEIAVTRSDAGGARFEITGVETIE